MSHIEEQSHSEQPASEAKAPIKSPMPLVLIGLVAVVALAGFGFMSMQSKTSTTTTTSESSTQDTSSQITPVAEGAETTPVADATGIMTIEVEGGAFYFKPNEIRVKAGQTVKVVLTSKDMQHDFVIDELEVKSSQIPGGQTTEVEFTPATPGSYEFYCSVGKHRANGMVGTLIVE